MPTVADPYARFVLGQKKREAEWNANRAAKRARPTEIEIDNSENGTMPTVVEPPTVTEPPTGSIPPTHQLDELKRQLEEKNRDCEALTKKVEELQEASQLVAERQLLVSEKFCKVCSDFLFCYTLSRSTGKTVKMLTVTGVNEIS